MPLNLFIQLTSETGPVWVRLDKIIAIDTNNGLYLYFESCDDTILIDDTPENRTKLGVA